MISDGLALARVHEFSERVPERRHPAVRQLFEALDAAPVGGTRPPSLIARSAAWGENSSSKRIATTAATIYETEGHRFESCRARPRSPRYRGGFVLAGLDPDALVGWEKTRIQQQRDARMQGR